MRPWKTAALVFSCSLSHHHDQVEKWDNGSGVKRHWVNSCVSVNSTQVFDGCSASESERWNQRVWVYVAGMKKRFSSAVPQCHVKMLQRDGIRQGGGDQTEPSCSLTGSCMQSLSDWKKREEFKVWFVRLGTIQHSMDWIAAHWWSLSFY